MIYQKTKNGFLISVKEQSNSITVKELNTGVIIEKFFKDHQTAIKLAKKL